MSFVTDKEELKPGLIIFRRADVQHRNWYCRMKLPHADRYKTVSLKTSDIADARNRAFDQEMDLRYRIKFDQPIFNKTFSDVAQEYGDEQERRAARGEISKERVKKIRSVVNAQLSAYVGTTQVHLIGQETWDNYPAWRRETGTGRFRDKIISDSTIRFEMSIFGATMNYAAKKKYITASQRFEGKPKLKTMRRDEFSLEEYRIGRE